MHCPNCGAENIETNRFCLNCGTQLPTPTIQTQKPSTYPRPSQARVVKNPLIDIVTITGITGILGGIVVIFGWLTPWFNLGGLLSAALNLLDLGGGFGLSNFQRGVGNGLQLTLLTIGASIAAFTDSDTFILGLFCLIIVAALVAIPIIGILNVRTGIKALEERSVVGTNQQSTIQKIQVFIQNLKKRSIIVFIIVFVIFIILSVIPFGTSLLGAGFYITTISILGSYFGAYYAQLRLRSISNS